MTHIWMSHVTHCKRGLPSTWPIPSEIWMWMSHVTHINESRPTNECVMAHIWTSHVTHCRRGLPSTWPIPIENWKGSWRRGDRRSGACIFTCQCVCNALQLHALQCTATHCSTLQHTATHCNTLYHAASAGGEEIDAQVCVFLRVSVCATHCVCVAYTHRIHIYTLYMQYQLDLKRYLKARK